MSEKLSVVPEGRVLDNRPGSSRKLLLRKAREKTLPASQASLEASFPPVPVASNNTTPVAAEEPASASYSGRSESVASAFPVTSPRERRPRPMLRPGDITPNVGTIVEAIVRLVVERGELPRVELIDLMSGPNFTHPKARPAEKGWSQGYVAGAIRNGFLTVTGEPAAAGLGTAHSREL